MNALIVFLCLSIPLSFISMGVAIDKQSRRKKAAKEEQRRREEKAEEEAKRRKEEAEHLKETLDTLDNTEIISASDDETTSRNI